MKPVISVIIPAYNEEKLLRRCLEALNKQTYPKDKYEVIVVDNDSSDKTGQVAKTMGMIGLHYSEKHIVAAVRNYGAAHAKGEIFAFMDADSVPPSDWLEKIDRLLQNYEITAVAGKVTSLENIAYIRFMFDLYHYILLGNQFFHIILPWGSNIAIKRKAFEELKGFDDTLSSYDDATMGIRLQKRFGNRGIHYTGKLLVYTSSRKHQNAADLYLYITDTIRNYINFVFLRRTTATEIRNVR